MDASRLLADRYRLITPISTSGQSEMWRAHDEMLGRRVAVRILGKQNLAEDGLDKRVLAEANTATLIAHPNIVSAYDSGYTAREDGAVELFFVAELIDGTTLAARMREEGRLPWRVAVETCAEAAAGLSAAHAKGLAHRAVSPTTILVTLTGAKLADLGTGLLRSPSAPSVSPSELAANDVHALGVVLCQALSGASPDATHPEMVEWLLRQEQDSSTDIPAKVITVCKACLEGDPAHRPTSAEMATLLARTVRRQVATVESPQVGAGKGAGPQRGERKAAKERAIPTPVVSPPTPAPADAPPWVRGTDTTSTTVLSTPTGSTPQTSQTSHIPVAGFARFDSVSDTVPGTQRAEFAKPGKPPVDETPSASGGEDASGSDSGYDPQVANAPTVMFRLGTLREALRFGEIRAFRDETAAMHRASATAGDADPADYAEEPEETWRDSLRSRWAVALAGASVLFVVAAVTAGVIFFGGDDPSRATIGAASTSGTASPTEEGDDMEYEAGSTTVASPSESPSPSPTPTTTSPKATATTTTATTSTTSCSVGTDMQYWWETVSVTLTIGNTGSTSFSGWTLTFTMNGKVSNARGSDATWTASGSSVTVSSSGTIAAGQSTTVSGQMEVRTRDPQASGFTLNGVACSS